jgi:hypothetical protein
MLLKILLNFKEMILWVIILRKKLIILDNYLKYKGLILIQILIIIIIFILIKLLRKIFYSIFVIKIKFKSIKLIPI